MYILKDGAETTFEEISSAFSLGHAVIIHAKREGDSKIGLQLDGKHFDTRGKCIYAKDESWTCPPETLENALVIAYYSPILFGK